MRLAADTMLMPNYPPFFLCSVRDCISKAVYSQVISWVVTKCNSALQSALQVVKGMQNAHYADTGSTACRQISVLDFPGFENFAGGNGLEQFLRNFGSERLHSLFRKCAIEDPAFLLVDNGAAPLEFEFPVGGHDSAAALALLCEGPQGIIPIIERAHTLSTKGSVIDDSSIQLPVALKEAHSQNALYFPEVPASEGRGAFQVRHYAGTVQYSCILLSEKNADPIWRGWVPKEVRELLQTSNRGELLRFPSQAPAASEIRAEGGAAAAYAGDLETLLSGIESSNTSFILAIRPNAALSPGVFDSRHVAEQLRSLDLVQLSRVSRLGGTCHISYRRIDEIYRPLLRSREREGGGLQRARLVVPIPTHSKSTAPNVFCRCISSSKQFAKAVLWSRHIQAADVVWGKDLLFVRQNSLPKLLYLRGAGGSDMTTHQSWELTSSRIRLWIFRRFVRLALARVRGGNSFLELLKLVRGRAAALVTIRNANFVTRVRSARARSQRRTWVRRRWRVAALVIVAVRLFRLEMELAAQAKHIQDEKAKKALALAARDEELLSRLDKCGRQETPGKSASEVRACLWHSQWSHQDQDHHPCSPLLACLPPSLSPLQIAC
jgi:myosin heavy subunit